MDMFRYLRSRMPGTNEAKRVDRDEFFHLNQTLYHGFPGKASCMAHDDELHLLAIGTKTGSVRVYGGDGVEATTDHPHETGVKQIYVVGDGHLVTMCTDSSLHLWSLVNTTTDAGEHCLTIEHVRTVATDSKLKTITSTALLKGVPRSTLVLGTETGNVYSVDCESLEITDLCIYDEIVTNAPEEFKNAPAGRVDAITTHGTQIAFGYTRGLIVVFDTATSTVVRTYNANQGVESLSFQPCGTRFVSSHNDGSYVTWSLESSTPIQPANIPFGPFPCKPMTTVVAGALHNESELLVMIGGMPRASFGDKHTVAVQAGGGKHVVFDCTSAVLQVIVLADDYAHSLLILCEEELVAIDLRHDDWAPYPLPYLHPLHASPITACVHVPSVADNVWRALQSNRAANNARLYSTRDWPIDGGVAVESTQPNDLLVTGHEDGHVRMWTCNRVSMHLLAAIQTARPFDAFTEPSGDGEEDDWPPFRKCGHYDPYSDDPRVSVQRVQMDGETGEVIVGGSAGQVLIYALREGDTTIQRQSVTIVGEEKQFKWKGNDALVYVERDACPNECFDARALLQIHPPAAVTAVALESKLHLLCAGTGHGFVVYDYSTNSTLLNNCLLTEEEMAAARTFEGAMSRFKSFKKSVRDSIRKRRRTTRGAMSPRTQTPTAIDEQPSPPYVQQKSPRRQVRIAEPDDDEIRPAERQIGGRDENVGGLPSLVKTIVFADTHMVSATSVSHTLWVGTNGGRVYAHTIDDGKVTLAKEVHLRHGAPVLSIQIAVDTPQAHHVVICTEEQLKAFTLPALRPTHYKYKLTAHEGVRMRRLTRATMTSEKGRVDTFVLVMTNNGTVHAFGHRHMRRFMHEQCVRDSNDLAAVLSTVLTNRADVFSLPARGSEWVRSSLAANTASQLRARCYIPALPSASNPAITINAVNDAAHEDEGHDTTIGSNSALDTSAGIQGDQTLDSIKDHTTETDVTTNGTSSESATNSGEVAPSTKSRHVRHGSCTVNVTDTAAVDDEIGRLKRQAQEQMKLEEEDVAQE